MLKHLDQRRRDEEGFTLIELMVVVLILGILMAIAIPTFLSTTNGAKDSAAESNLVNTVTDELSYFSNNNTYQGSAQGSGLDPQLPWVTTLGAATTGPQLYAEAGTAWGTISTTAAASSTIFLAESLGTNNDCYVAVNDQSQATPVTVYAVTTGGCPGVSAYPASINATGHASQNKNTIADIAWYDSL